MDAYRFISRSYEGRYKSDTDKENVMIIMHVGKLSWDKPFIGH